MATCDTCGEVFLIEGDGIQVTGSGTPTNPYVIESLLDFAQLLRVRDTGTVNLTLIGSGTTGDPFELRASTSIKLTDLIDIADPSGGPSVGETLIRVGTGPSAHWEYGALPPSPAGAVNATVGIDGIGSVDNPLKVSVSGTWGQGPLAGLGADSTIGLVIYEDSAGMLRARPVATAAPGWADITGKPSTFPPTQHFHNATDLPPNQQLLFDVGKINGKRITTTLTSSTPPANPSPGDIWLFPRGA